MNHKFYQTFVNSSNATEFSVLASERKNKQTNNEQQNQQKSMQFWCPFVLKPLVFNSTAIVNAVLSVFLLRIDQSLSVNTKCCDAFFGRVNIQLSINRFNTKRGRRRWDWTHTSSSMFNMKISPNEEQKPWNSLFFLQSILNGTQRNNKQLCPFERSKQKRERNYKK